MAKETYVELVVGLVATHGGEVGNAREGIKLKLPRPGESALERYF